MTSSTAGAKRVSKSINTAFRHRPWSHAIVAAFVGIVFGYFLRIVAIAALLAGGSLILIAALVVLVAAIAFGALGRAFTGRRSGWVLVITVIPWAPVVIGAAFIIFASEGQFNQSNLLSPVAGGVVAAVVALLAHKGFPRWLGLAALVAGVIALVVAVVSAL
jgi:hypothetical protein